MLSKFWVFLTVLPELLQVILRILDYLENSAIENKKEKIKELIEKGFKDESSDDLNKSLNQ
jgi:hypothetical protein